MANLETAITDGGTPVPKEFHFRAPASALETLAGAGLDVVTMANNHGVDYGESGLADTLAAKKDSPIPIVGIGADAKEAFAPATLVVGGVTGGGLRRRPGLRHHPGPAPRHVDPGRGRREHARRPAPRGGPQGPVTLRPRRRLPPLGRRLPELPPQPRRLDGEDPRTGRCGHRRRLALPSGQRRGLARQGLRRLRPRQLRVVAQPRAGLPVGRPHPHRRRRGRARLSPPGHDGRHQGAVDADAHRHRRHTGRSRPERRVAAARAVAGRPGLHGPVLDGQAERPDAGPAGGGP